MKNRITRDPLWYKDAVIYETHVKAFLDGNGDGVGDFRGLAEKLDYLEALGVTCLWLLPFFPSPLRDDGYDIADYRDVHPSYGSLEDFRRFLEEAHRRGLAVLVELVINHTSDRHPWFQRARRAPAGSPERDYYVWSDTDRKFAGVRIIFTDTEKSNWTWDPEAKAFYWHRFFGHQPDLNFDNPRVVEEIESVIRFWLDLGVDGFRLDAIPYLVEREGTSCENLPETHAIIKRFRAFVERHAPGCLLLAEANQWPEEVRAYFGDGEGDECHMAYHFPVMPRLYMAIGKESAEPIVDIMRRTPAIPASCQWAMFLRNHDELTLEMVTDEERAYMYRTYAQDPRARINVGIRRRLAPLMESGRRKIELLNGLVFSFPGTPVVYYGDEIGMGDDLDRPDRDGVRTPMQWAADPSAGFSARPPGSLYSAPVSDPAFAPAAVNVEAQLQDRSSLLHWMRELIRIRKQHRVFGRGTQEFLDVSNRSILAYVRRWESEAILCVANLSRDAQRAELDLAAFEGLVPVDLLGGRPFPRVGRQPWPINVGGHGFHWLELRRDG